MQPLTCLLLVCLYCYPPQYPWSHFALDFPSGLTHFNGNTFILTIMEYFSKADHFVHLPEFPTYQQTIEMMAHCVFRLHNIPLDVISDQAPNSPPRYRETSTPHWELKWVHHRAFTLNTLKYTHNTMTSYATGLYLFWVFAALEDEIIVSSRTPPVVLQFYQDS